MTNVRLERIGAIGGILFVVPQLAGQALIQVGGSEPPFDAASQEIVEFFQGRESTLFNIGSYLTALSLIALLGLLGSLWNALGRAEDDLGLLSVVRVGAGLGAVAVLLGGGAWHLAVFRIEEGLDPQIARLLFDFGNFTFASSWALFGALTLSVAAASLWFAAFPRWLGWTGLIVGIFLISAPLYWTSPVALAPYLLFWAWLVSLSVVMTRRARA